LAAAFFFGAAFFLVAFFIVVSPNRNLRSQKKSQRDLYIELLEKKVKQKMKTRPLASPGSEGDEWYFRQNVNRVWSSGRIGATYKRV
jgi:hypothetical protein